jgi:hypothetical protein
MEGNSSNENAKQMGEEMLPLVKLAVQLID